MFRFKRSSSFCLICYKTIEISNKTRKKLDNIEKFVKIVTQFAGSQQVYPLCELVDGKKLLECCRGCRNNIETFCNIYDQIKLQELNMACIVDAIGEKILYGDRFPTRCFFVGRVLENIFGNDLGKTVESQYRISKFRQTILEVGKQKKMRFEPSVVVNRTENDDFTEQENIKEEVEEKFSPGEENEISEGVESDKPNGPQRRKSASFSIPANENGNGGIARSNCLNGHANDTFVEDSDSNDCLVIGIVMPVMNNSVSEDTSIEVKEEPQLDSENMEVGLTEESNSTPDTPSVATDESDKNTENREQINSNGTNGIRAQDENCGEILNAIENSEVDSEYPNDWKRVCENSLRKFGTAANLISHLRKKQKELARRENNEPSLVMSMSNQNIQQSRYRLKENRKVKRKAMVRKRKENVSRTSTYRNLASIPEPIYLECNICTRKFRKISKKNMHFKMMHDLTQTNPNEIFNCAWSNCKAYFVTKRQLRLHYYLEHIRVMENKEEMRNKEKEKPFDCDKCNMRFERKWMLKRHHEVHSDPCEWKVECEKCGQKFASKFRLRSHLRFHKNIAEIIDSTDKKKFRCEKCGKRIQYEKNLKLHLELHKDPSEWKFECIICGKKYVRRRCLMNHFKKHKNENYRCECLFCGMRLKSFIRLQGHLSRRHAII